MPDLDASRAPAEIGAQRAMLNYAQMGDATASVIFQDPQTFMFLGQGLGPNGPGDSWSAMTDPSLLGAGYGTPGAQASRGSLTGFSPSASDQLLAFSGQLAEGSLMHELYDGLTPAGGSKPGANSNSAAVGSVSLTVDAAASLGQSTRSTPYVYMGEQLGYEVQPDLTAENNRAGPVTVGQLQRQMELMNVNDQFRRDLDNLHKQVECERAARQKVEEELRKRYKISVPRNVLDIIHETCRNMFGCFEKVVCTEDPDEDPYWDLPAPLALGEERRLAPDEMW
ncbi:hypothetical protein LXA43DRAFT_1098129 [Ganoderma leucocontextum]|nr:hypothetical protein LXA43DRAFT_1098129 [Ganoderma leucocontextum]